MQQDKKTAEFEQIKTLEQEKAIEEKEELKKEIEIETFELEVESGVILEKKKRREVIFEMALFLVLGILLGVTIKTEAVKRITIGFNDYQITKPAQSYNVTEMKKALDEQMAQQEMTQQEIQPQEQAQPATVQPQ
jgi:hypothetical protein